MRRVVLIVAVAGLVACATSRNHAALTHVRLTTWPESARVSLDCDGRHYSGTAPLDFEFPEGPYARCKADLAADHYQPLHVDIDRQYLFDHGELKSRETYDGPRLIPSIPYGPGNVWTVVELSIVLGVEHLINAGRNAALAGVPDVTLKISMQPETSS